MSYVLYKKVEQHQYVISLSLPLPVLDSSFESWIFFPYAGSITSTLTFLHLLLLKYPRVSIKENEKAGWKHKEKERGKVERGKEV